MLKDPEDPPTVVTATAAEADETETGRQPDTQNKMMQYIAGILRLLASIYFNSTYLFHPNVNGRSLGVIELYEQICAHFMISFVVLGAACFLPSTL